MDFQKIDNFLGKFKEIVFKNEEYYLIVCEVIKKHILFDLNKNSVSIKGSKIYIKASPMVKNEIMIHKKGILEDINNLSLGRKFTDIFYN